jgi:hypothetical protein
MTVLVANQSSNQQQIAQASFDVPNQAVRMVMASNLVFQFDSATDSITAVANAPSESAVVPSGTATSTVVVAPFDVSQTTTLNMFTNTTSPLTETGSAVTLQLSPSDTDNVWISSSLVVNPSDADGIVAGTPIYTNGYRRAQVLFTTSSYTAGSFTVYANGR